MTEQNSFADTINRQINIALYFAQAIEWQNEVYIIIDNERIQMTSCYQDEIFEYYTVRIHLENRCYRYRFEIDGNEILFYNIAGADTSYSDVYDFSITPGFNTPDWAKGAVMYQIYVERFLQRR